PTAQVVDRDGGFQEDSGVAVADAEDETADADLPGGLGERRHGSNALERRLRGIAQVRYRVEVVPDRAPVKPLLVRDAPEASEVVDGTVLGTSVDAEAHRVSIHDRGAEVVPRDGGPTRGGRERLGSGKRGGRRRGGRGARGTGRRGAVTTAGFHLSEAADADLEAELEWRAYPPPSAARPSPGAPLSPRGPSRGRRPSPGGFSGPRAPRFSRRIRPWRWRGPTLRRTSTRLS